MVEKETNTTLRKPYYETGDSLYGLAVAILDTGDEELIRAVNDMLNGMTRIAIRLNEKYLWD